ncbi:MULTISPECIES: sensor histidine kinase [unclassified Pseudonocardia]|uniref:sensor histidine kinase n=1 Tax=unclassified Pseudonocardia TaxID=2619320 RepID=UPI0007618137|nr:MULTISPECIES: histidine kinase [unclassified Pseudonocardia]
MTPSRRAPLHPVAAVVSGVVSLGLLASLPVAASADPTLGPLPQAGATWAVAAVLVLQASAVVGVGRFPTALLPALTALPLVLPWTGPGVAYSLTAVAQMAGVLLAVAARPPRLTLRAALAVCALLLAIGHGLAAIGTGRSGAVEAAVGAVLQAVVVVGLPLLVGLVIAARRDTEDAARREREAWVQAAVSRERTSMSRELHDIAAHHMSGIALMATAVERQVDSAPAAAKHAARQIREQSQAVLQDLRRLVGLLREDADGTRPVRTLDAVAELVGSRRAAGARIELRTPPVGTGRRTGVGPLAELVAYRMAQESLANAAAHAPGAACTVTIEVVDGDRVTITVRNEPPQEPGPDRGGGFGLVGMAERAQLVGGELDHGPTSDGGWQVRLTLPVADRPRSATASTLGTSAPPYGGSA